MTTLRTNGKTTLRTTLRTTSRFNPITPVKKYIPVCEEEIEAVFVGC